MGAVERVLMDVSRMAGKMDSTQWICVMVGALVLGYFILSGYGSKLG